ncbi:MAG: glycosyltransferase family 4 protein [Oscillochloris sp.]|nr:glycosyltransferase family 4 protein [Oscillochloris sp.]
MRRLNILTWHIHGSYLNSLARIPHTWYIPTTPERGPRYGGRGHTFDMPANVREVPAEQVRDLDLDLLLYQDPHNLSDDQAILSPAQRRLPAIYLEHNTPRPDPTATKHCVDDPNILLVHVTPYNRLMWDNGRSPTMVIEHSVAIDSTLRYSGRRAEGASVVNGMGRRGRLAGADIFNSVREQIPLTLFGMGSEAFGGVGDIPYRDLHRRVAEYRFFFSPMRYTSLPLAVVEAMMMGMPVVALATTELPTVIEDGVNGFVSCDPDYLIARMHALLEDRGLAARIGAAAHTTAMRRFSIERFQHDWNVAFGTVLAGVHQ